MPIPYLPRPRHWLPLALLALAGLAPLPGAAQGRQVLSVGATVVALSQCSLEASAGLRCSGGGIRPAATWSAASDAAIKRAMGSGRFTMKVDPSLVSVSFTGAATGSRGEPVVLTIAP